MARGYTIITIGLPIPFPQKLLWVIGEPIRPPSPESIISLDENSEQFRKLVDELHSKFCDELTGIFERHKHNYGWYEQEEPMHLQSFL